MPGRYHPSTNPPCETRPPHIDRLLVENNRVLISERNGSAPEPFRRKRDLLRRRRVGELVPFARFRDIPVLTKPASEIASRRAEGEHARSGQKMVQRFFLDRIDTKPAAPAISGQHDPVAQALPNETKTALAIIQFAKSRT